MTQLDERLEKYYGKEGAPVYDITTRLSGYFGYYTAVLNAIKAPKEGRVLDIGCGSGMFSAALTQYGNYDLIGVDIAPHMLAYAMKNAPKAALFEGDVFALDKAKPFGQSKSKNIATGNYDLVVSAGMIEYLDNPEQALEIMLSQVRVGGQLVMTTIRDNIVGQIASKLYGFSLVDNAVLERVGKVIPVQLPLTYPNVYLRSLKQSAVIQKEN